MNDMIMIYNIDIQVIWPVIQDWLKVWVFKTLAKNWRHVAKITTLLVILNRKSCGTLDHQHVQMNDESNRVRWSETYQLQASFVQFEQSIARSDKNSPGGGS